MYNPIVSHHLTQLKQLLSKEKLSLMDVQVMKMMLQELAVLRDDYPEVSEVLSEVEARIAQRMASK